MTVRFDDSLGMLVRVVADKLGPEALARGVVLRDATGRLAFFNSWGLKDTVRDQISEQLREVLGVYGRTDRIIATPEDFGTPLILDDPSILTVRIGDNTIRVLDRRLVGADWLRKPRAAATSPPRFVFASLKGGVGRSTALAIVAADIASQGRRVLAVDMDMEAPGLGSMLLADNELPEFGLIDALVENGLAPLDEAFFADLHAPSSLAHGHGRIDVLPAFGRRSLQRPVNVLGKIARAYIEDVKPDGSVFSILDQVASIVDHFALNGIYDAILIDARSGLRETTAAAILGLGAEVFLFGLNEHQTFVGYSVLLSQLALFLGPERTEQPEWLDRITMVQGRAPIEPEQREDFAAQCQLLFELSGLVQNPDRQQTLVTLPAEPFHNVPWDDDLQLGEIQLDEPIGPRSTIAVLDDERFRLFNPRRRSDLLSVEVYRSSYGALIERVHESIAASNKVT